MEAMSHAEYIDSIRSKAALVASEAITGRIDLLEACHLLSSLLARAELQPGDSDATTFSVIASETDALPIGSAREQWAPAALERLQPELNSAMEWATPLAMPALESVVRRFGA